ncbi:uncharacterized protein [Diadema setosum]|uniref:uncharacterized protein n=1 Tax=Diadema setosum TaxID=31175 RepID=UPI003B3A2448
MTIVCIICCSSLRLSQGAAIIDRFRRSGIVGSSSSTSQDQCTLDYGIHLQLTAIESDIERIFLLQYVSEGWELSLLDETTCFPHIESSSGYNGQWIAARVEQIRQVTPWYTRIEDHITKENSVLPVGFHSRFISLVNMINSTLDRLEYRMNGLRNHSRCNCPDDVLNASAVLTTDCFIPSPPEVLLPDTLLRDVAGIIKVLYQILHDLNARRVEHAIC